MKTWFLIYIMLTSPYVADKDKPYPLVKFADELFASEQECKDYFRTLKFKSSPNFIVGFCLVGDAMMPAPGQMLSAPVAP